jgi:hypothetical protein
MRLEIIRLISKTFSKIKIRRFIFRQINVGKPEFYHFVTLYQRTYFPKTSTNRFGRFSIISNRESPVLQIHFRV